MVIYRMTDIETGEIIHEGYGTTFVIDGKQIDPQMVSLYSTKNKIYYYKYKFERIGKDNVNALARSRREMGLISEKQKKINQRKASKDKGVKLTPLEEKNQQARDAGTDYGNYIVNEEYEFYQKRYLEWLELVLNGKRRFVCG